jgi:hypothetical protein
MKLVLLALALLGLASSPRLDAASDPARHVPDTAPRTTILAGRHDAFRAYVSSGPGAAALARIKTDFDARCFDLPFPEEPLTYGDPSPSTRDSTKVDLWRGQQDTCGRISAVAEAATMLWIATGEERYLEKAREWLLGSCSWSLDASAWASGPGPGATDVAYNDEAHFRLWRRLPLVYDQLREHLSPDERATVLAHFRARGTRSVEWIKRTGNIERLQRNSLAVVPSSHPVRFMPMTALSALALWDELPEARDWWEFAYLYYRDRFPPFGGDDGGWAEGVAYWRGVIEHAAFQDALAAIGDPLAYSDPFWRNTPYFQIYNVQPYRHTAFGDLSNAGRFNLEPVVADFMRHLARMTGDGRLPTYASLLTDTRPPPAEAGLANLDRIYPTAAEFLVRNFTAASLPLPAAASLDDLPQERWFRDVGWVSMHSALGRPSEDIHATFVSSPYGSFSHSHAHQNAFILNAWGENLAIASGYREFHNSPHHDGWTRQTVSKNAILIDGHGQNPRDRHAIGAVTRYESAARWVLATGDAAEAYRRGPAGDGVERVTRDFLFVDRRYVVIRDRVTTRRPSTLSWLLHAEKAIEWDEAGSTALVRTPGATLTTRLVAADGGAWRVRVLDTFPVPVDPKYVRGGAANFTTTGSWQEQSHLFADTVAPATDHTVFAVVWPERGPTPPVPDALRVNLHDATTLVVTRPDGRTDRIHIDDTRVAVD